MCHRAWIRMLCFTAAFCSQQATHADTGPQPPCEREAFPLYPELDHSPVVKVWGRSDLGRDWIPPACTGWSTRGFSTLVATVARFREAAGMEDMLRRVGSISGLRGIRYWSATQGRWQELIMDASALAGAGSGQRRGDFSLAEVSAGGRLYFQQSDNLSGRAAYRLQVSIGSTGQFTFATENISTIRYLMVPLFGPGEIQSIYFLQQETPTVWLYYNLTRTGAGANRLVAGHEASSINRAVAFFRHWASIPTDKEPPAAR